MATSDRATLTVTDLVGLGPVIVLAVVATASLAWAHAHHHSLLAVLLTSAVALGALGAVLARRVRISGDRYGVLAVLGCGVVAAVLFFPGFSYGVGDKDPGVYTAHAVEIARTGSYSFTDPATATPGLPVVEDVANARLPAIWVRNHRTGLIVPQFFHLWPALLATAYDIGGYGGLTATTPLVGVVAVLAFAALLRRVGGPVAAAIGGVLLASNMLEVWQAKFATTEMLAQALFVGSLLAVVLAIQQRWGPAAAIAGALTGVGFLNRADGWLLVMLAAAALATLWVARVEDRLTAWAAAGLAAVMPYALFQAYGPAHRYTVENHIPDLAPTLALLALVAAGAVIGRRVLARPATAVVTALRRPATQRGLGLAVCAGAFALLVLGFLRTRLFGQSFYVNPAGLVERSYDEQNLRRLSWFVTFPGLAAAGIGLALVALRRWRADRWALALPTLVLTPLYIRHAHVAPRLMWWTRRFVPHVLPGLLALVAIALACAAASRLLRPLAALLTALLLVVYLGQSLPLRSHDEWHGSFGVGERIAALSGDRRGVYLWARGPCCAAAYLLFATPVWLERDELSVLLPERSQWDGYIQAYRAAFPQDPLFVVVDGATAPPAGAVFVARFDGSMPFWEETYVTRPRREKQVPYDVRVYRVP